MSGIFKWIKNCFNYYILGITDELVSKINDAQNDITPQVKQELIESIMTNKPDKLVQQLNDKNNAIPENVRNDLMTSIMKASTCVCNDIDTSENKMGQENNANWKRVFDDTVNKLTTEIYQKEYNKHSDVKAVIPKTSILIRHDIKCQQNDCTNKDWKIVYKRVMKQLQFKKFISECRKEQQIQKQNRKYYDNFNKVVDEINNNERINNIHKKQVRTYCKPEKLCKPNNQYKKTCYNPIKTSNTSKRNLKRNNIIKMDCKWNQHY